MRAYLPRACLLLAACLVLAGCPERRQIKDLVRSDLFSLGYGLSENQIAPSAGGPEGLDVVMREGIFHILDGSGRKIMRLSSYGDLLALLYDPSRTPEPRMMKPAETQPADSRSGPVAAPGRYAAPLRFVSPEKLAVDSGQTVFVVDRVANPAARIYDPQLAAYCDRIVRRFGDRGEELPYVGQEGPGGSPFPYVMAVDVLENDTFAVVSASESIFQIHHFGKAGNLLSSLRLDRENLPLPEPVAGAEEPGLRMHASLDRVLESDAGDGFVVTMKIDYYRERFDPESQVLSGSEFAGSWLIMVDGATGIRKGSLAIAQEAQAASIDELVGASSGYFYFLSAEPAGDAGEGIVEKGTGSGTGKNPGEAFRILRRIDAQGKVDLRRRIDFPEGSREVAAIKVSSTGQLYALIKTDDSAKVVFWDFR